MVDRTQESDLENYQLPFIILGGRCAATVASASFKKNAYPALLGYNLTVITATLPASLHLNCHAAVVCETGLG